MCSYTVVQLCRSVFECFGRGDSASLDVRRKLLSFGGRATAQLATLQIQTQTKSAEDLLQTQTHESKVVDHQRL